MIWFSARGYPLENVRNKHLSSSGARSLKGFHSLAQGFSLVRAGGRSFALLGNRGDEHPSPILSLSHFLGPAAWVTRVVDVVDRSMLT